jgi:hypothetical protein
VENEHFPTLPNTLLSIFGRIKGYGYFIKEGRQKHGWTSQSFPTFEKKNCCFKIRTRGSGFPIVSLNHRDKTTNKMMEVYVLYMQKLYLKFDYCQTILYS